MPAHDGIDLIREMLRNTRRDRQALAAYADVEGVPETLAGFAATEAWCFYQIRCAQAIERGECPPPPPSGLALDDVEPEPHWENENEPAPF